MEGLVLAACVRPASSIFKYFPQSHLLYSSPSCFVTSTELSELLLRRHIDEASSHNREIYTKSPVQVIRYRYRLDGIGSDTGTSCIYGTGRYCFCGNRRRHMTSKRS